VELYNIPDDPSERNNVAAKHPEKVAALQDRVHELAATMVKPMFLEAEFQAVRERAGMPPAFPAEYLEFNEK
jgi:hypothetical protein